jgi:hypothetical protein
MTIFPWQYYFMKIIKHLNYLSTDIKRFIRMIMTVTPAGHAIAGKPVLGFSTLTT